MTLSGQTLSKKIIVLTQFWIWVCTIWQHSSDSGHSPQPAGVTNVHVLQWIRANKFPFEFHYLRGHYNLEHLQATSITVEDWVGPLTITAIYCPPKHTIKADQFQHFYTSLGHRFLAGGDYNTKHTHWGSRLIAPRGRELLKAIQTENLICLHGWTDILAHWQKENSRPPRLRYHERNTCAQRTSGGWLWSVFWPLTSTFNIAYKNYPSNPSIHPKLKNNRLGDFSKLYKGKPFPPSSP